MRCDAMKEMESGHKRSGCDNDEPSSWLVGLVVKVTRVFGGVWRKREKMKNDKRINKECGMVHDDR